MSEKNTCCPQLPVGKKCDYLDFVYRLTHFADVGNDNKQKTRVPVEVAIHVRLERCTGEMQMGNLVYSTTLIPGEKVRLFSLDRRSRFSFDTESQLTYRHEQKAEEQYYMDSYESFMSKLESKDSSSSSASSSSSGSTSGSTSGIIGTLVNGPSVSVSGSFNASSTREFVRELSVQAESSHNKSINMTREASSVSIGEVQSRKHSEGESESSLESSSRTFQNNNRCHAVSYLFYQINKVQTVKLNVRTVRLRVIDSAGDSSIKNEPVTNDEKLKILPAGILATSKKIKLVKANNNDMNILRLRSISARDDVRVSTYEPLNSTIRDQAVDTVMADLKKNNVLTDKGRLTKELEAELEFEFTTSIPTPGIVVKGCLDECNVCEPALQESIKLEIENKKLKNQLLQRQIDLLESSQEYRCCPVKEEESEVA